ncbi:MAG: prepilin-type N-terminal cleavage/methylation domain-containing protein [Alphaproteobacteria bacterium]
MARGKRSRLAGAGGFTMLEILIVLVIIAMAAALVAPAIDGGLRAREVRSAVRRVAGTLRGLQGQAIQSGKPRRAVLDASSGQLVPEGAPPVEMAPNVRIGQVGGGEVLADGSVQVTFYPNGSNSGVDVLIGDRELPLNEGYVVRLNPLLGMVTVEDPRS